MVDDDQDSLDLLSRWLAMEGYEVRGATRAGALQRSARPRHNCC
jgi:DNA-binding response OmpR family regulator